MSVRPRPGLVAELAARWTELLGRWAIPDHVLSAAPESPWGYPTTVFVEAARVALTAGSPSPSQLRGRETLTGGGTVLDVGAGGGAASLPLVPPADRIVAVDESKELLEAFHVAAADRGVPHETVLGRWPDVAGGVGNAALVVCHHVAYNVGDMVPFVTALDDHATRRVVIELTEIHPQAELNPLWRALHGIDRPEGPVADDLIALLRALGIAVHAERFVRPALWAHVDRRQQVAFARRRLCVGPERDGEIEQLLPAGDRRLVTLWWDREAL